LKLWIIFLFQPEVSLLSQGFFPPANIYPYLGKELWFLDDVSENSKFLPLPPLPIPNLGSSMQEKWQNAAVT
jgi:hypothetical protein